MVRAASFRLCLIIKSTQSVSTLEVNGHGVPQRTVTIDTKNGATVKVRWCYCMSGGGSVVQWSELGI